MTKSLRVLVACEFRGTVRNAFLEAGHDAWSCDLLPAEDGSNRHIRDDVRNHIPAGWWDLLVVAHPPCTRLCNSGVRWLHEPPRKRQPFYPEEYDDWSREERLAYMWRSLDEGADLFSALWNAPVGNIVAENPVMHPHAKERIDNYQDPAQTVQPYQFGDPFLKATSLYMRGDIKPLTPTEVLEVPPKDSPERKEWERVWRMSPGEDRGLERSRFFPGIARAMAEQLPAHINGVTT